MILRVDIKSATPVFEQIVREVKSVIARGASQPGDMIPSVRQMAGQLLVNPNTVAKAYRDLEREGILYTRRGHGAFVGLLTGMGAVALVHFRLGGDQFLLLNTVGAVTVPVVGSLVSWCVPARKDRPTP